MGDPGLEPGTCSYWVSYAALGSRELGRTDVDQERAHLANALGAEPLGPLILDVGDDLKARALGRVAAVGQADNLRATVTGVRYTLGVAKPLEVGHGFTDRLLGHPSALSELGQAHSVGLDVGEHAAVCSAHVGVAGLLHTR